MSLCRPTVAVLKSDISDRTRNRASSMIFENKTEKKRVRTRAQYRRKTVWCTSIIFKLDTACWLRFSDSDSKCTLHGPSNARPANRPAIIKKRKHPLDAHTQQQLKLISDRRRDSQRNFWPSVSCWLPRDHVPRGRHAFDSVYQRPLDR
jgi:hypothetical protein